MRPTIINYSLTEIVICFIVVGYAAVDLVPCDKTRRIFTDSWGVISDGPLGANYTQDSHCEWLIKADQKNNESKFITLSFRSMGTECSYDYVFVYDGDSFNSTLLGSFSGKTEPQQVVASSGYMLVLLYSDTNYVLDGFRAEFSITDCPNNCSYHGVCHQNHCICDNRGGWGGIDCSKEVCPNKCGSSRGRGYCDKDQDKCVCSPGYSGQSCSLFERDGVGNSWHWLSHSEGGLQPRAAHSAVYIETTDSLYVFGGYNLNNVLGNLEVYDFRGSAWKDENGNVLPDRSAGNVIDLGSVRKLLQNVEPEWEMKWGLNNRSSFFKTVLFAPVNDEMTHSRRRQRHSRVPDTHRPAPRYGHAACAVSNGFVLFGGKLNNGSLSNDLWYYNVETRKWKLRAQLSNIYPPQLTRHTLTCVNDVIYLFGGSTPNGDFSSELYRIELSDDEDEQWVYIQPRGGKQLDVRVVAHTTVYHTSSNSLLVYGGIVAGVARFSKLSDRMFSFQIDNRHWTEIHYTREHLREKFVPRERAFHTANIFGNYLVIFGGYSHRHNKEEICYDNQMYLYHLGCHTWVNPDILGKSNNESEYPKQQGVFAHAAEIRNGNTLLLVGGYHGNVNGDLLAYVVPPMIASRKGESYDPESVCTRHRTYGECSADPECGWCTVDDQCYGRTIGANCTTNLFTTRCPGICPALGDCHSCLIHGHVQKGNHLVSAAHKLGLEECTWCVQNARCHHKDDNYGVCGLLEDSPGGPGWWGSKGTEIIKPEQCRELDKRPGLTFVRYYYPVNLSQPDNVIIINATTVDYNSPSNSLLRGEANGGKMVARLLGYLHLPSSWHELLNICISYCTATLTLDSRIIANVTAEQKDCKTTQWPANLSEKIMVDFNSVKLLNSGGYNSHQQSKMELQHYRDSDDAPKVFTFEYLEPYANGSCDQYKNCLHCLTDSQCGWCELTNSCQSRLDDETVSCVSETDWKFLILQPSACSNCSNYISCDSCVGTNLCEWWVDEAKCTRVGQKTGAAITLDQCPTPCYKRTDCGSCLEQKGRCVWCQATQQCFSFSVYTSEYQFGLCREWLDQAFPLVTTQENSLLPTSRKQEQCKSCARHKNCSSCLSSLSCGWCYNATNPMRGQCVQGDFTKPQGNCSDILELPNAKWAYAQCPDVDECGLGLHDCHPQAICTNTDGSFSCQCKKGYIGDGRKSCIRTCYNVCVHGICLGEPDYACKCNIGWYGEDCSKNCGCNNHSNCSKGYQICEECQDNTMGEFCQFCRPGSYGNATTAEGCSKCECNGHGDKDQGECDIETGTCYCQDNTEGDHCERCKPNYSGDPRNGNQCYYQCESRGILNGTKGQGISSIQSYSPPWSGAPTRECLWIIKPDDDASNSVIQLEIKASQLNVTCGENAVYVFDGPPGLAGDSNSQSQLSAAFCTQEALPTSIVESKTGQLVVHYKQGLPGESFSAVYKILSCDNCDPPRECRNEQCLCPEGFVGFNCEIELCPKNCSYSLEQGSCDKLYGRCLCNPGWAGPACSERQQKFHLVFTELFDTMRLSDQYEHLRKTLPRFGHSLVSDRRGSLWMFGGFSLSHGPLNDIRLFDTRNITWMQVTVESTPDAKMPQGRYFHSADIVHSRQAIYVYGGLTKKIKFFNNRTLNDLWVFDIQNQRWNEIETRANHSNWPPGVYGHTLTYFRYADKESLVLIGGESPQYGFLNMVWEYRLDKEYWQSVPMKGLGPAGIIGHTTVAHSNSLYIFGGYVYDKQISTLSNTLYKLDYETKTWVDLNSHVMSSSVPINLPKPRFFHSAVTTDNYMLVLGGRIYPWNISDTLYAFSYNCNQWINLMRDDIHKIGAKVDPYPRQTYAQAMTIEHDGDAAYVIGGWGIDSLTSVLKIDLPLDICNLFSSRFKCLRERGCGYCANKLGDFTKAEICHSNTDECPMGYEEKASRVTNQGSICTDFVATNCSSIADCALCNQIPHCHYCNDTCTNKTECPFESVIKCPYNRCIATDCIQCHMNPGCEWSYSNRQCELVKMESNQNSIATCSQSCINYSNCTKCLETADCRWSTQLNECISSSYQPIYCAGGTCGLVLEPEDKEHCPEPCRSFTQCDTCLKHAHCGWCAAPGEDGIGVCAEGSSERPLDGTCDEIYVENKKLAGEEVFETNVNYTWHYVKCPQEDECKNGHHTCSAESEICVDQEVRFQCVCSEGYKKNKNRTACEPVCPLGCVRGQCVQPNQCLCDFGYVGANCSIQCQCNGHANCEGPDKLDKCLQCHNNTMGAQCEKCKPLFVGDPANGGQCVPCLEYCHGHSSICVDNATDLDPDDYIDYDYINETLKEGPKSNARCLRCANLTAGSRCDGCILGNFRGSEDHTDPCRPCDCHGHGDTCDPVTGEKCNCMNNTESDSCGGSGKNSAHPCWSVQCSKCKEGYLGTPTSGHQCYKQMPVESKMCFDAKVIDECKTKPNPLHPGEVVFFVIQPRYMNVDIRIIIDVTQGRLNVFMSTHDDTYVAFPNTTSGLNDIELDHQYRHLDNRTVKAKDVYLETEALGLRTYITVTQSKSILFVKSLQDRLVITLPEEYHSLETTRFFLVLQSLDPPKTDKKVAYGIVFSRQDQLHIDLFVFFSVFFSCFFLFLAACVVAWKAKQAADVRRARRRHVVEMLHMAKRPFAGVTLNLAEKPKPKKSVHYDLRPVAVEPTGDGLAAVATVFVSLPGGQSPPGKLALASTLILLRSHPSGRIFPRRRSIHAVPPT